MIAAGLPIQLGQDESQSLDALSKYTSTREQIDRMGKELDQLYHSTKEDLGEVDTCYIKSIIKYQRYLEVSGRVFLHFGYAPALWGIGTLFLSFSKILENMEVGHNILHGQYDWTNDQDLNSHSYEWDIVCDSESWREYHNFEHHTFTNILGKDRDFGYHYIRLSGDTSWKWYHGFQVASFIFLTLSFQWGVALHGFRFEKIVTGEEEVKAKIPLLKRFMKKSSNKLFKDYVFFPMIAFPNVAGVFVGNLAANTIRNIWTSSIIFCGHFPEGVSTFTEEECENENRSQWYYRQILGSCNFEGQRWLHILSGHLSYQMEHHLFPDLPSHRYGEIAPKVKEICHRYGVPYNTGSLYKQYFSVIKKILKFSLPWK